MSHHDEATRRTPEYCLNHTGLLFFHSDRSTHLYCLLTTEVHMTSHVRRKHDVSAQAAAMEDVEAI